MKIEGKRSEVPVVDTSYGSIENQESPVLTEDEANWFAQLTPEELERIGLSPDGTMLSEGSAIPIVKEAYRKLNDMEGSLE